MNPFLLNNKVWSRFSVFLDFYEIGILLKKALKMDTVVVRTLVNVIKN